MESNSENTAAKTSASIAELQGCQFAFLPDAGTTVGVVSNSEPSSLALLAAGIAGMAARRARRERDQ